MSHALKKRRIIAHRAEVAARGRTETRDAILLDVSPSQRKCRVKFQGAIKPVTAYFPTNWAGVPRWLKPGNSVRVAHVGGNRHRLEVYGDGGTIPTPIEGDILVPVKSIGANCVVTGMVTLAYSGMSVSVSSGTYRINDVMYDYSVKGLVMGTAPVPVMGVSPIPVMGAGYAVVSVPAADATRYRIDVICIGIDGVLDYVIGDYSSSSPVEPGIPSAHVKVASILVPPSASEISQLFINRPWTEQQISSFSISVASNNVNWADGHSHITVTILDQYSNPVLERTKVTAEIFVGSGTVTKETTGSDYTTNGEAFFVYNRVAGYNVAPYPDEESPIIIKFTIATDPDMQTVIHLILLDELGEMMF